jgi:hypothetical protein
VNDICTKKSWWSGSSSKSACLAKCEPSVQTPVPPKKKKKKIKNQTKDWNRIQQNISNRFLDELFVSFSKVSIINR